MDCAPAASNNKVSRNRSCHDSRYYDKMKSARECHLVNARGITPKFDKDGYHISSKLLHSIVKCCFASQLIEKMTSRRCIEGVMC